ncbi:PID-CTERM protein-sorting domain-containing protein [Hymenobacter sp. B81]|uniref:PID-CTERM protein-sorting domain-containing protein n=1 Tax=Hymenobacter sp. B81 TaxID=3344878 RepID=UPI0037DCB89B
MHHFCSSLRGLACTAALLLLPASTSLLAQGNPGSGGPQPGQPTAVPLDGGASLLLAAGAAYGLKKLRDARRR